MPTKGVTRQPTGEQAGGASYSARGADAPFTRRSEPTTATPRVNGQAAAVLQLQQAGTSADHIAYLRSAGERDTDEYASA
jgi:hypothetical protein